MRNTAGPLLAVFAGAVIVLFALDSWAWQARRPCMGGLWRFRRDRIFRSELYTEDGNRRPRIVVVWFTLTAALAVIAFVLMLVAFS